MNLQSLFSLVSILALTLSCNTPGTSTVSFLEDPSELSAVAGETSATLTWKDNCTSEKGYYVFLDNHAAPVSSLPENSKSFVFTGLAEGSDHNLGVQAYGENNSFSKVVWARVSIPAAIPPEPDPEPDPNPIDAITFNWTEVSVSGLPAAVKIYQTQDKLNGRAFHAWYAIADPAVVDVRVLYPGGGSKATIDKQAADAGNCLVLVNGGIFGTAPIGFALLDGQQTPWRYIESDNWAVDKQYWGPDNKLHTVSRGLFGVDKNGKPGVYWSFTPSYGTVHVYDKPIPSVAGEAVQKEADSTFPCEPAQWVPYNAITCGPVLLQNGRCPITGKKTSKGYWETNYEMWADDIYGVNQLADRTAVGYTSDGKVILFICDGRIDASQGANTLEMAQIMKGLDCQGALNLDGGGSTGMWAAGQHLNDLTGGNRAVMTTIGFFTK